MTITVRQITATDAYPLRRTVLRTGTVSTEVSFDGDDHADGFHLGAFDDDALVGISSWLPVDEPRGFQLRGMATDPERRGEGIGALLLAAGLEQAIGRGALVVVANARVPALEFYRRYGFDTFGEVYIDDTTGLPHQRIRLTVSG